MQLHQLLTIGHSNRTIEAFIRLLAENNVTAVADVRSQPYSRHHPHFNAESLKAALRRAEIAYVFLGKELGARRTEPECYENGQAKYELIEKTAAFRNGLDRLLTGMQSHRIAITCAENDPLTCHRMILICRHLRNECDIFHILGNSKIESNEQAETRLLEEVGLSSGALYDTKDELVAEAYEIQGKKIAFRKDPRSSKSAAKGD